MKKFWNEKCVALEFFHSILAELMYGLIIISFGENTT